VLHKTDGFSVSGRMKNFCGVGHSVDQLMCEASCKSLKHVDDM
jgi:hypothetical protein